MDREHIRPNILFAIADDASHLGSCDDVQLLTPVIDRLIKTGVVFSHAYTTNPKCAPSRASILTGRHTWQLKQACNHFGTFPSDVEVYTDMLEKTGYFVGYTGKGWAPGDWRAGGRKRNPAGDEYNGKTLTPPENTKIHRCDYAANFFDFLDKKSSDEPFCFWYGGFEPHRPYRFEEGLKKHKQKSQVEIPPYLPQHEVVAQDLLDYVNEIEWFDAQLGKMIDRLEEMDLLEHTLIVVTSDNGMPFPRVKGQMYEDDCRLPLIIRWPSRIPGGRTVDDLVSSIDLAPTFLSLAGSDIPDDWPGTDLADCLLTHEQGTVNNKRTHVCMGKERHDMGRENDVGYPVRSIRTQRFFYSRNFAPDRWPAGNPETGFTNCDSSPSKALILTMHEQGVDAFYRLAFGKRPSEELYDMEKDPHCMHNVADHPAYAQAKNEVWKMLERALIETNDPRIFGQGDQFDAFRYVGDAPHSWAIG